LGVVHARPEGAWLMPVTVDRVAVAAFLDARRLFAWDQGPARRGRDQARPTGRHSPDRTSVAGGEPCSGSWIARSREGVRPRQRDVVTRERRRWSAAWRGRPTTKPGLEDPASCQSL